nr:bifunctional 2-C-methyl-D-erythritol 4-phosphate cytidylyltransferase/2-C-methyl-D-erythritol 2,4-cyclodiphosphate synthase [Aureimonas populi]
MTTTDTALILVAGGRGERAGDPASGPKQYRLLAGKAVIWHSLRAVLSMPEIATVVVVIHPEDKALFQAACGEFEGQVRLALGESTRQGSVLAGLRALRENPPSVVLIHDAVRPFAGPSLIRRVATSVGQDTASLPAIPVADTLKRAAADGTVGETVSRAGLYAAQTPQGFPFGPILAAHEAAFSAGRFDFTDDAALAEWAGLTVRLVEGSPDNVKLTLAADIAAANLRLRKASAMLDPRTGNGYDVHRLVPGDHVTLCGVRIEHDQRLDGHSDADVGLHALTDALLATCGAGDIGDHFPPSDPQWRGASSDRFVHHAARLVGEHGGRIANADITLICEAPKIAGHRLAMREAIARMLGISLDRVSVKATTNETIGFVGRREGIAAIATATVLYGMDA